jgi:hypothetical protein
MVQPALRDEEWRDGRISWLRESGIVLSLAGDLGLLIEGAQHITIGKNGKRLTALIAMANAALADDDGRKLTRAHLDALRAVVDSQTVSADQVEILGHLASALEAYLPR